MDSELIFRMALTGIFLALMGRSLAMNRQTPERRPLKLEFPAMIAAATISGIAVVLTAREGEVWLAVAMSAVLVPLHGWTAVWAWRRRKLN